MSGEGLIMQLEDRVEELEAEVDKLKRHLDQEMCAANFLRPRCEELEARIEKLRSALEEQAQWLNTNATSDLDLLAVNVIKQILAEDDDKNAD